MKQAFARRNVLDNANIEYASGRAWGKVQRTEERDDPKSDYWRVEER